MLSNRATRFIRCVRSFNPAHPSRSRTDRPVPASIKLRKIRAGIVTAETRFIVLHSGTGTGFAAAVPQKLTRDPPDSILATGDDVLKKLRSLQERNPSAAQVPFLLQATCLVQTIRLLQTIYLRKTTGPGPVLNAPFWTRFRSPREREIDPDA